MLFFLSWFSGNWLHDVGVSYSIQSNVWGVADDNMRFKLQTAVTMLLLVCGTSVFFYQIYLRSVYWKTRCMMTHCQVERDVSDEVSTAAAQKADYITRDPVERANFDNVNSTFAKKTENITHIHGVDSNKVSTRVPLPKRINFDNRPSEKPPPEICPQTPPDLGKYHKTACRWASCQIRYVKLRVAHAPGMPGKNVFPATSGLRSRHALYDARVVVHAGTGN